jgi:hypothetical protein
MTGHDVPLRFALWVPVVVPFLAGALMAKSRFTSKVVWRGQAYELNAAARLATSAKPSMARVSSSASPSVSQRLHGLAAQVRQPGQRTSVV